MHFTVTGIIPTIPLFPGLYIPQNDPVSGKGQPGTKLHARGGRSLDRRPDYARTHAHATPRLRCAQ